MNYSTLHRKIILAIALVFIVQCSFGQMTSNPKHPLYEIDKKLKTGNKNAFFEIAPYFDSKKELTERFAYNHISATTEAQVARRIVEVNSIFTDEEIRLDSISSQVFLNFLNANSEKITYSDFAGAFFITPLESRTVKIMFREITKDKKRELKSEYKTTLNSIKNAEIKLLIKQKDPKVLFIIASELYKGRDWLNTISRYNFESNVTQYIKLIQILTDCEIAVEGYYNKMTWHIEVEFYHKAALNLLCYFSANYSKFKWNEKKQIFENKEIQIIPIGNENDLFQLLSNKNDSIALDAFTQLTTCNPQKVRELADEYEYANIDKSWAIPTFPYRFLKQLVLLTDYCNANEIDFVGSTQLKSAINKLSEKLSFSERRSLEDNLINNLTLEEITAFEYWALINEKSRGLTYSAGRILDVFYSKNWDKLLKNEKQLNCYLKKSALFNRLGIIGICNKYLVKFVNSPQEILEYLEKNQTSDEDIKKQIEKIIKGNNPEISEKSKTFSNDGNYDCEVTDLEGQLVKLTKSTKNSEETDKAISKLLSQINYEQISTALNLIENYSFQAKWLSKYSFMKRDFGFFMIGDFDKPEERRVFLNLYSQFSEYELYSYYLDKAGIDYKTNSKLDFDKIYELLKYNVVVAFVGGGGGKQDNEVYSLVKLLELTFNTTLGFPKKLCNSNNMYGCDSSKRAKLWRKYLTENNLSLLSDKKIGLNI